MGSTPSLLSRRLGLGQGARPAKSSGLQKARRRFQLDGIVREGEVSPPIGRSWARCIALGLAMDAVPDIEIMSYRRLLELRDRNEELVRTARGEMEALDGDARQSRSIAVLTDPHGVILARTGSVEFAERASRVSLRPGVAWGEAHVGTNAIGTALAEKREVCVSGAEHFFEIHRVLNCSAVPIFDPHGEIIGVLDLSNAANVQQTHTLALARRAVDQIESHLFNNRFRDHEQVHFHCEPSLLGGPQEGLLAFEDERLVGANRNALRMLGLDWSEVGKKRFWEIFDGDRTAVLRARSPDETRLRACGGASLFARFHPEARTRLKFRAGGGGDHGDAFVAFEPVFDEASFKALGRATRLVDADLSVLVQGEAGTGKEMFARRIHAASRRSRGPFAVVDCSVTNEIELTAALFGSDDDNKPGALRQAEGGIVLLDEIGALPPPLQTRLMRELGNASSASDRAGTEAAFDVALISTTRQRLRELVAAGVFREDLFARLAAYTVEAEPLRRHADRSALILAIWRQLVPVARVSQLTPDSLAALSAYSWPGNHRQLVATLRTLAVLARGGEPLGLDTLPEEIRNPRSAAALRPPADVAEVGLDTITLTVMRAAVAAENGNISRAARRLGIHRSTLYRRLFGGDRLKR